MENKTIEFEVFDLNYTQADDAVRQGKWVKSHLGYRMKYISNAAVYVFEDGRIEARECKFRVDEDYSNPLAEETLEMMERHSKKKALFRINMPESTQPQEGEVE